MAERTLEVLRAGPQASVQDLGRPGLAHLGVPRSGALDAPAHALANRLVGNEDSAATLECLDGRILLRATTAVTVAVTGARTFLRVAGREQPWGQAVAVPAGAEVELGAAEEGLRAYVAVSGGFEVHEVLGSRSTDQLSGLGPDPVSDGTVLPLGRPVARPVPVEATWVPRRRERLRLRLGPREDWFDPESVAALGGSSYVVGSASNRIGLRLEGPALRRTRTGELDSEGMVLGAVQVPPNGQPVVFLNDHPTTGGYPVVGVVLREDLPTCAQLRPGEPIGFEIVG